MKKKLFILGFCLTVGSCGSVFEKDPVGIGPDYAELKKSPCACLQLKLQPGLPEWLS